METRDHVVIVGKGCTAIELKRKDFPNSILVGVNQSPCLAEELDYSFANDVEGLYGLTEEHMKNIKTLAIPEYPHYDGWSKKDVLYTKVTETWGHVIKNFLIYNLWTTPKKNTSLPTLDWIMSTGDAPISYFAKYHNIKKFDLYGIGVGNGYHPKIKQILPKDHMRFANGWTAPRIKQLSSNIEKLKNLYNLQINIH
ncbi:MAG: hypothetical protein ACO25K_06780 [Candidatus Fonsibacter ubiquis]